MTPAAHHLLRLCVRRTIIMQSVDRRWEAAQELIAAAHVRVEWAMGRAGWRGVVATDLGRAVDTRVKEFEDDR